MSFALNPRDAGKSSLAEMNFRDTPTKGKAEAHVKTSYQYHLAHTRCLVFNAKAHFARGLQHEVPKTHYPRVNFTLRNLKPQTKVVHVAGNGGSVAISGGGSADAGAEYSAINLRRLVNGQVAAITGKFESLVSDGARKVGGFTLGKTEVTIIIEKSGGKVNNRPAARNKHKVAHDVTLLIIGSEPSVQKVAEANTRNIPVVSWLQLCAAAASGQEWGALVGSAGSSTGGEGGGCVRRGGGGDDANAAGGGSGSRPVVVPASADAAPAGYAAKEAQEKENEMEVALDAAEREHAASLHAALAMRVELTRLVQRLDATELRQEKRCG